MDTFEIFLSPTAQKDLNDIQEYISFELLSPRLGKRYVLSILEEIKKLTYLADSDAVITEEPWSSYGIRKRLAKKFFIYYYCKTNSNSVHILRVVYAKRDQKRILNQLGFVNNVPDEPIE